MSDAGGHHSEQPHQLPALPHLLSPLTHTCRCAHAGGRLSVQHLPHTNPKPALPTLHLSIDVLLPALPLSSDAGGHLPERPPPAKQPPQLPSLACPSPYLQMPVATFQSGPVNSLRGAALLSGLQDGVVIDVGGTTTDVGVLVGGLPRPAPRTVKVAGAATNFQVTCGAVPCHAMSCYATLCCGMLCHAMVCCAPRCAATRCLLTSTRLKPPNTDQHLCMSCRCQM